MAGLELKSNQGGISPVVPPIGGTPTYPTQTTLESNVKL